VKAILREMSSEYPLVLVSGVSGYIGSWVGKFLHNAITRLVVTVSIVSLLCFETWI
jgi:nucleoside-diphosphate-sugar epimerase